MRDENENDNQLSLPPRVLPSGNRTQAGRDDGLQLSTTRRRSNRPLVRCLALTRFSIGDSGCVLQFSRILPRDKVFLLFCSLDFSALTARPVVGHASYWLNMSFIASSSAALMQLPPKTPYSCPLAAILPAYHDHIQLYSVLLVCVSLAAARHPGPEPVLFSQMQSHAQQPQQALARPLHLPRPCIAEPKDAGASIIFP